MDSLRFCLFIVLVWVSTTGLAETNLSVAELFKEQMVLQQEMEIPVWGKAKPDEKVTVRLADREVQTVADKWGRWIAKLPPMHSGGPHAMTVTAGDNTLTMGDVLIGEVWLCSGQSNMEMQLAAARDADKEIAEANYPSLRFFKVAHQYGDEPQESVEGIWRPCNPQSAGDCSAVAYFFGKQMYQELNIPIGLIDFSKGGSPVESWIPSTTLISNPEFKPILDIWNEMVADYQKLMKIYQKELEVWSSNMEWVKAEGRPVSPRPATPILYGQPFAIEPMFKPASLYNGQFAPLVPYAARGGIWYQGEFNALHGRNGLYQELFPKLYRKLFPALIRSWRAAWGQPRLHFYFVQLTNFLKQLPDPQSFSSLAGIREAQAMTLSLPDTAMAVIIDVGEADDIHPKNKQDVGLRLALPALNKIYGKKVPYSGPMIQSMRVSGNKVILCFEHTEGGLTTSNGEPLKGVSIAGEDRNFVRARAEIRDDEVHVWSDQIHNPVAVRYAWVDNPECNLYNGAGLPASPFRTDGGLHIVKDIP